MGRADIHVHTRVSDGLASVETVVDYAEHRTLLDVVAVTDHEDATGGLRAREYAARRGYTVEVVPGAEVTTLQGHLLALFIEEAPPSFRSIEATVERIREAGGLAVAPHPLSPWTRSLSRRTLERLATGDGCPWLDAVELANPSPAGVARQREVAALNDRLLGLPGVGGSDAHHLPHIGTGWTEFPGRTAEDLRDAIGQGNVRGQMSAYPPLREIGYGKALAGLAWGYSATPRKMVAQVLRR